MYIYSGADPTGVTGFTGPPWQIFRGHKPFVTPPPPPPLLYLR